MTTTKVSPASHPKGTPAVGEQTGLTFRQLTYWQRIGVIRASQPANGSGSRVYWSDEDIQRLHRIARFVRLQRLCGTPQDMGSTALIERLWRAPLDEVVVVEGEDCRLIIEP